jgi:uncharacterized protein YbcV (DUF1398 family)
MKREALQECHDLSHRGVIIFPEVVRRLLENGVERYSVDFVRRETTCYGTDGSSERLVFPEAEPLPMAESFGVQAVQEAIRAAQRDEIRYPEFMRRILAAGCVGYTAYLTGKRVVYEGRLGDFHVEHFPKKNP